MCLSGQTKKQLLDTMTEGAGWVASHSSEENCVWNKIRHLRAIPSTSKTVPGETDTCLSVAARSLKLCEPVFGLNAPICGGARG